MRKISEIYSEYNIIDNLRDHMLRVAAVAMQICDYYDIEFDKDTVIKACIIHDMGNIVKFNFDQFPEFFEPQGVEYWKNIQKDFIERYGKDDHKANMKIAKEIGVGDETLSCIDAIDFLSWVNIEKKGSIEEKICAYADTRVAPCGVVSLEERLDDGHQRYKHTNSVTEEERLTLCNSMHKIEKELFENSKIQPKDITDDSIEIYLEKLKDFLI